MIVERVSDSEVSIAVTDDELDLLVNCLNEVCNGITVHEFETRLGAPMEDVYEMLHKLAPARKPSPHRRHNLKDG
jgi:hypothetical protein